VAQRAKGEEEWMGGTNEVLGLARDFKESVAKPH